MRDSLARTFLTFVLIFWTFPSLAAPVDEVIKTQTSEKPAEVSDPALVGVTPGSSPQSRLKATLSWVQGDLGQDSSVESQTAWGLSYSYNVEELKALEWQAHWTSEKRMWLQYSERRLISYDSLFLPYYKYGASFIADPEDGLSSMSRIDSYFATAGVGILDVGQWGEYLTYEMGLSANVRGLAFHVHIGLQYHF